MNKSKLPLKKEGDRLGATHINELSRAAELTFQRFSGSYGAGGVHSGGSGLPEFVLRSCVITALGYYGDDDEHIYTIKMIYFDPDSKTWKTDDLGGVYLLDDRQNETWYVPGDKLQAYFDAQRNGFVPLTASASGEKPSVGIVREDLGCGRYIIELGYFNEAGFLDVPGSASNSNSNSSSTNIDCNPCVAVAGEGTSECGISISNPSSRVIGTGVLVYAFDTFSDKVLLQVGTDCLLTRVKRRSDSSESTSDSNSASDSFPEIWQIANGYHEHIVKYEEDWDCCEPGGPRTLLRRRPNILIGHTCEWITCGECPSDSSSASG